MTEGTDNLVIEILRNIQADVSDLKQGNRDLKPEIISVRKQLHTMQGDSLHQEQAMTMMQANIERIKSRLNLVEA